MDRALLLQHFGALAETPDAVTKLRTFIFDFAVHGRLVEQNPKDTPAAELLKQLEVNKRRLFQQQNIKAGRSFPQIEDAPYQLPSTWKWTALGNTGQIFNGNSVSESVKFDLSKVKDGLPFIATKDIGYGRESFDYENGLQVPHGEADYKVAHKHAVLICAEGGSAGRKMGQTDRDICFGNKLLANEVWEGIQPRFILSVYQSSVFFREFSSRMTGIIGGIARSEFLTLPIPIPPPEEQIRIVAKVEELLALCDELEATQTAAREQRTRLVRSALDHLTAAKTEPEFRQHAAFVLQHSDLVLDSVTAVRQAILSLAVKGHLTEQNANDGNATDLLRIIAKHKEQLVKAKLLKAREIIAPIEEVSSILPGNWAWCRLAEICLNITDGYHNTPKTTLAGVRYITAQHIRPNVIDFDNCFFVSEVAHQELVSKTKPKKGDILVVNIGAGSGTAAIINADFEFSFKNVAILNKYAAIDSTYLYYVLHESRPAIFDGLTKGGAQPFLSLGVLRNIVVALPPLAEQQRIVAKVDELMRWCDALEARLTAAQTTATTLLDATLAKILSTSNNALPDEPIKFLPVDSISKDILTLWPGEPTEEIGEQGRRICSAPPGESDFVQAPDMLQEAATYYWLVGMTKDFRKSIRAIDRKLQGRILEAINDISESPVTPNGDTVKPLTGDMKDFWRYRIGDFRLVYLPNREKHQVTLWTFAARGGVYE